jgi:pyridoxal phosphate enzyme (YggS family)
VNKISENLKEIRSQLPENVQLVCVSKFHPQEMIMQAYKCGERDFAESRAQELLLKEQNLPKDIRWHFIGPLQSNKIKQIVGFIHLIQSMENEKLLEETNRCAKKINRKINVLLEVHIAQEEQKHGFSADDILAFFQNKKYENYPFVEICGLMGIATFTDNKQQIENEFININQTFNSTKNIYHNEKFQFLSIGMSDDCQTAIKHNSTMVRIGSRIFGNRIYPNS